MEQQRKGRNKETIVNSAYINSGEYKRNFDIKFKEVTDYDRSLHGNRRSIILIFEAIPLTSNIVILLIILA